MSTFEDREQAEALTALNRANETWDLEAAED